MSNNYTKQKKEQGYLYLKLFLSRNLSSLEKHSPRFSGCERDIAKHENTYLNRKGSGQKKIDNKGWVQVLLRLLYISQAYKETLLYSTTHETTINTIFTSFPFLLYISSINKRNFFFFLLLPRSIIIHFYMNNLLWDSFMPGSDDRKKPTVERGAG